MKNRILITILVISSVVVCSLLFVFLGDLFLQSDNGFFETMFHTTTDEKNASEEFNQVEYQKQFENFLKENAVLFADEELNQFVTINYDAEAADYSNVTNEFDIATCPIEYTIEIDETGLKEYIKNLNKTSTKAKNAKIIRGETEYEIVPEVLKTSVKPNRIYHDALQLASQKIIASPEAITLSSYYKEPKITTEALKETLDELNSHVNWTVEYDNGTVIRSSLEHVSWDGETITIDDSWINWDLVNDSMMSYYTVGKKRKFFATGKNGKKKKITVSGGTWGTDVDCYTEIDFLKEKFNAGESLENRTPEFYRQQEDIGDTYIEISIEQQHLWFYKKGKLKLETDVVTGRPGGRDTPTGIYYISECIPGKYLTGPGYRTWVNYWMRLTSSGVGLHDAYWKSSFGGELYKTVGSHGCINLPKEFAPLLYEKVYVQMPVIIYF